MQLIVSLGALRMGLNKFLRRFNFSLALATNGCITAFDYLRIYLFIKYHVHNKRTLRL